MALSRNEKIIASFLFSSYFLTAITPEVHSPFLPRVSEQHGQSRMVTGWMLGFLPMAVSICNLIWAKTITKIGVRNMLRVGALVTGLFTAAFSCLEFIPLEQGLAFTIAGFLIRIIHAVGLSAVITTGQMLVTDLFPLKRTFMLSVTSSLGGLGMLCAPAIGSGLFQVGGFWLVFVGVGGMLILLSIFMFIFLPEHGGHEENHEKKVPYKRIFTDLRILLSLMIGWFCAVNFGALGPILEPELRTKFRFQQKDSALMFLVLPACFVTVNPVVGRLVGRVFRFDSLYVTLIGLTIKLAIFLLAGPSSLFDVCLSCDSKFFRPLWLLVFCLAMIGFSNSLLIVSSQDVFYNIERLGIGKEYNGMVVKGFMASMWYSIYCFGTFCGSAFSGTFAAFYGWSGTMTAYAILSLLLTFPVIALKIFQRTKRADNSQGTSEQTSICSDGGETSEKFI